VQRALDQAAGLNTAGFISGYRGSPLGAMTCSLRKSGCVWMRPKCVLSRELMRISLRLRSGVRSRLRSYQARNSMVCFRSGTEGAQASIVLAIRSSMAIGRVRRGTGAYRVSYLLAPPLFAPYGPLDGTTTQARVRSVDGPGLSGSCPIEGLARHRVRRVRIFGRAAHGAARLAEPRSSRGGSAEWHRPPDNDIIITFCSLVARVRT
jgi:hypothetical protein